MNYIKWVCFYILLSQNMFLHAIQDSELIFNSIGSTPLSAIYRLSQTNQVSIHLLVKGKDPSMDLSVSFPVGYGTEFPVHGLYPNYTNIVIIKQDNDISQCYRLVTKKLDIPPAMKTGNDAVDKMIEGKVEINTDILVNKLSPTDPFNQDFYFVSLPLNGGVIAFDKKGDIRYRYFLPDLKTTMMRMEYDKGQIVMLLIDEYEYYQKVDLLGRVFFREKMSVHHEAVPYINGQELILGNSKWGWEDMIFILDENKKIVEKLSLGDAIRLVTDTEDLSLLDQLIFDDRNIFINEKEEKQRIDWAHMNSLVYDENTHMVYLSLRHLGIVAVRMIDWTMVWFMADENLKIDAGFAYGMKPKNSLYLTDIPSLQQYRIAIKDFQNPYPKGQHALLLRKNGNLMMFDNQGDEITNNQGSRIVEYQLNPNKTAKVVREYYNPDRNYARLVSDIDLSGNNHENLLMIYGFGKVKRIMEIGSDDTILFDMQIKSKTPFFRVDKFPLYPYSDNSKKYSVDYKEQ